MLKTTRWSPDTCGCILEYEWDDTKDGNARTHSFKRAIHLCEHHKGLEAAEAYGKVVSENARKNMVFGLAKGLKPDLEPEDYIWSFDKDRKLTAGLGKLTTTQKTQLRSLCDGKFGSGKVEVD